MSKSLNFNIGMLGHVDSGKTSLSKALSTVSSTAAFDKNPQSKYVLIKWMHNLAKRSHLVLSMPFIQLLQCTH